MKSKPNEAWFPKFSENISSFFVSLMVIEIFKFENRTSDGENFLPIGRDDSPVYFVLYDQGFKCWFRIFGPIFDRLCICLIARQVEVIWVLPYLFPIYPARHHLRNSNTWFYILFHVLKNEMKRFLRTLRIKCYYSSIMLTNTYWLSQKNEENRDNF